MPVDKLCKFDYGAKDASMVEQALKKTQAMKKQVILAYLVACLSREQDPYRVFEMANITAN